MAHCLAQLTSKILGSRADLILAESALMKTMEHSRVQEIRFQRRADYNLEFDINNTREGTGRKI